MLSFESRLVTHVAVSTRALVVVEPLLRYISAPMRLMIRCGANEIQRHENVVPFALRHERTQNSHGNHNLLFSLTATLSNPLTT